MPVSKEEMLQSLQAAGYRMTRQRECIIEHLTSMTGDHPSARQVFAGLKDRCEGLSVATVYNTLGTLARLGLVKVIEFEAGDNRYEKNLDPHVNLICTSCGSISDFGIGSDIHARCAREQTGFHVTDFRLEYYGLCAGCASRADLP